MSHDNKKILYIVIGVLVVAAVIFGLYSYAGQEAFIRTTLSGLTLGSLFFLVAAGLTLIFGLMDVLNFAHGSMFMLGAYAGWQFYTNPTFIFGIHGLDFIAITDHNQPVKQASFPKVEGLTIIPGQEWTHYKGHSNFLGLEQPYKGSFIANSPEEVQAIFREAHQNGALISINHPYEANFGFRYDLDLLAYDLIEVWNGPMRPTNLEAIARWDAMLKAGRKQVATSGSDYHEDTFFQRLASPCIYVLADSNSETDILKAVKAGRSYFAFSPTWLQLLLDVEGQIFGASLAWREGMQASLKGKALEKGDVIRLVTRESTQDIFTAPEKGDFETLLPVTAPGYWRLEVWRTFFSFLPPMPALITNPMWFEWTK